MPADEPSPQGSPVPRPPSKSNPVPAPAIRRLSLYLRELEGFPKKDRQTVSSKQLGKTLGYSDAQVRKDLAYFGQFGHPGVGYRVDELITTIRRILGTDRTWNVLLVGAGNLGQALLSYRGFAKKGFQIVAVFDNDPAKIGNRMGASPGLEVLPVDRLAEVIGERNIQVGIIAVPAEAARSITDALLAGGIQGILNFAPASLNVPENVPVLSVELASPLEQLAYHIGAQQADPDR